MSNLSDKKISIKNFETFEDYKNNSETINEEVIEILNFDENKREEYEKEGFFYMPNYITYMRKTDTYENVLADLSKNKRKKVKKGEKEIESLKLIKEESVSRENFDNWYETYEKSLSEKDMGILLIKKDWPETNLNKSMKVGMYIKEGDKVIAGILARSYEKNDFSPRRLSISYSVISEEYKNTAINDYLNAKFIEFAKELGFEFISRGRDTNLYGKHLSSGIPIFKTAMGYEIFPYKKIPDMLIKFNGLSNFHDKILFFSYSNNNKLVGNLIFKNSFEENDYKEYMKSFLSKLRIYSYDLELKKELSVD